MDGALIVNKPSGLTSHDVVARLRRLTCERSIGHLGTLDPAATGVLPLLLGRLTRLAQYFQGREKEYRGEIRFGFATDTYDAAGQPATEAKPAPSVEAVAAMLPHFRGHLHQTPPPFSAKKIGGVPAHERARRGEAVALAAVQVELRELEMLGMAGDRMEFRAVCTPGTYMRSLAHDLGVALGSGAHLTRLQRTRVGEFELGASIALEALAELAAAGRLAEALLPPLKLLPEFPAVVAPPEAAARLLHGQSANLPEFSRARMVKVFSPDERLLALGRRIAGSLFHPEVVFSG
ncbi:MAG TPA: tRNA pseudouridine(55) synthase TruB [Terriglobales bacterium]|nr:tRNA pseudouridine(55) synthase TruB [Terriglobales bacterium]